MIIRNLAKAKNDSEWKGADEAMQDELETADGDKSSQMKKNCQKIMSMIKMVPMRALMVTTIIPEYNGEVPKDVSKHVDV